MAKSYKDYTFEEFFQDKMKSKKVNIKENSKKLWDTYILIKKKMEIKLGLICKYFPHYSSHDAVHSENIIKSIEKMLGKEQWESISITDAWIFLCCAYLHDIGMIIADTELVKDMESPEFAEFINKTKASSDEQLRLAAEHIQFGILDKDEKKNPFTWAVTIRRDVMLLAAEFYRPKHPNRVEEVIKKDLSNFLKVILSSEEGFVSRIIPQIAKISAMHGTNFEYMLTYLPITDSLLEISYHPRFVAALLRLGDLCDYDCDRFSMEWVKINGGLTKTNLLHYYKHQFVETRDISPEKIFIKVNIDFERIKKEISGEKEIDLNYMIEDKFKIVESYTQCDFCNSVVVEANSWLSWIKEELGDIKRNWNKIAQKEIPLLEPEYECKVLVNGEIPVFGDKNIRFVFSNEKAYSLIEGYNLYDDQLIFVRELIQNSLDALKMKFWHDLKEGRYFNDIEKEGRVDYSELQPFDFKDTSIYDNYKIIIKVEHKEGQEKAKFIIEDNGIGISIEDLKNKIVNTGTSWNDKKKQKEMEDMPKWLQPTGSFGIGLHSVFTLSDNIYIQTKTEGRQEAYEVILHSGKRDGYVLANKYKKEISFCEEYSTGTHIEVILDMNRYNDNVYEEEEESTIFKDRPESSLCFAIERKIEDLFISPLFEIQYNCGKEIKKCKKFSKLPKYSLLFDKDKRNKLCDKFYKDKNKEYDFVLDRYGRNIIIWLRRGIIFYFSFDNEVEDVLICCKGIKIKNIKIKNSLPWIKIKQVDILSGNSNKILVASRNELKKEWEDEIKKVLGELNQKIAEVYYNLLLELEKKEEIKQWCCELEDTINLYIKRNQKGDVYSEKEMIGLAKQYRNKEIEYSLENTIRYIIQKTIICIINEEIDKIKKFIKEDKPKKIKGLGKKVKEKIKKESYLIELITSLINTIRIELGRELEGKLRGELGNALGIELGRELGIALGNALGIELGNELGIEFGNALGIEFGNALGIEFGRELGNEFGNAFGGELGNAFGNAFGGELGNEIEIKLGIEFGRELGNALGIEFGNALGNALGNAFGNEFGNALGREFGNEFGIEFKREFGREFEIVFEINWGSKFKFEFRRIYKKIFKEDSLNFIRSLPFYSVISLIATIKGYEYLCKLQVVLENKILANSFGYNLGYYFINKKNVCDIFTSSTLEVYEENFSYTKYKLPFISYIPCNSLLIGENNKIILNFDMKKLETRTIEIKNLLLIKCYLNTHSNIIIISAFKGYERISIKEDNNRKINIPCCTKNYRMVLWQKFEEIKKHSLSSQQEKQQLIDKLMNYEGEEGLRVKSVINYTYRNRAYINKNETYEQTIENIRKTYRQFISDVLDCIMLSDEELKNIRFEDREDLL